MAQTLIFVPWQRSGIYELASASAGPVARLSATVRVELADRNSGDTRAADLPFYIMGPGDVNGVNAAAVRRMLPPPNTLDAETTKYVHVELAASDLPWRYTPQLKGGSDDMELRPWLVLVVGQPQEMELLSDNRIKLTPEILEHHPLNKAARYAHVQIELDEPVEDPASLSQAELRALIEAGGGRPIARLLSWREMEPEQEYMAAIVPTFAADGSYSWGLDPSAPAVLPNYFSWRFRTGKAGDFRTLAARLRAVTAPGELGRAPLTYDRIDPAAELEVRGAIAPVGGSDADLVDEVRDDTVALTTPLSDPRGRPVVTAPRYGEAWRSDVIDNTTWGEQSNADPRHRGVAGLGGAAGISLQDTIADAVTEQVGPVLTARQRITQLVAGLQAAGSLWQTRLPADPMRRMQLYGPALRRIATPNGAAIDQIAGEERALSSALFSSAARRALRNGPARSRHSRPGASDAAAVLPQANRCPSPPDKVADGLASFTDFADHSGNPDLSDPGTDFHPGDGILDALADKADELTDPEIKDALLEALEQLKRRLAFGRGLLCRLLGLLFCIVDRIRNLTGLNLCVLCVLMPPLCQYLQALHVRCEQSRDLPYVLLVQILLLLEDPENNKDAILALIEQLDDATGDSDSVSELGETVQSDAEPDPLPCTSVDLTTVEGSLTTAIDPTAPNAWIKARVLSTIEGLEGPELAPVEICTSVDLPTWRFLRDHKPDWLLPGIGQLKVDSVYAFESNPAFVDAFLLGINTQTLGELRWRNLPITSRCTPLRMFWGRIAPDANTRVDDIRGVHLWGDATPLGDDDHSPAGGGTNLVLVFRSDLFHRYPDAIVSAIEAALDADGNPDFSEDAEPSGEEPRVWPVFQGNVSQDVTFFGFPLTPAQGRRHWLVIEEPPPGYRFRSDLTTPIPADGANFASSRFNDPTRVLIKGDELIPGS